MPLIHPALSATASAQPPLPARAPDATQPPIPPVPPELPLPPELPPFQPVTVDGALQGVGVRGLIPGMALSEAQTEKIAEIREMLSTQLNSVKNRRSETAEGLRNATGADREGLERLLRQLDARILQIEADIEHTARVLTEQPVAGEAGIHVPPFEFREGRPDFGGDRGPDMTAISIVFTLFVLAPMALAAARLMWRRATFRPAPAASLESGQRLERVEQALDSIAVEVERISEGQRFVTRILTEGSAQSVLNAGQRDAAGLSRREGARVPVDGSK